MSIHDEIKKVIESDPSFYSKAHRGTVTAVNADGTLSIQPKNTSLPLMTKVGVLRSGTTDFSVGDDVVILFDADSTTWAIGTSHDASGADWVPLGTALVSVLQQLADALTTHTNNGYAAVFTAVAPVPTSFDILSKSVKVRP